MARSARRTTTYEASVLEAAERVRTSAAHRRALVELTGHDPRTESALFNDLAKLALDIIERRALETGYRQLSEHRTESRDSVDTFLEAQALSDFDYEDDGDPTQLFDYLARNSP